MRTFTTSQASKFTGLPVDVLHNMRTCSSRRLDKRGPPFCRFMNDNRMDYKYHEEDLIEWMRTRRCRITANDAAFILNTSRSEVMKIFSLQRLEAETGDVIIDTAKNFFLFISKRQEFIRDYLKEASHGNNQQRTI